MIPPIRQLSTAALTYPGPLQLPTILSQKQFQTIWSIDEDLRRRTEQWIVKECPIPGKGPQLIDIITSMVRLLLFFNAGWKRRSRATTGFRNLHKTLRNTVFSWCRNAISCQSSFARRFPISHNSHGIHSTSRSIKRRAAVRSPSDVSRSDSPGSIDHKGACSRW